MAESRSESFPPSRLLEIFELFESVGYRDTPKTNLAVSDKLASGVAWCIAAVNGPNYRCGDLSSGAVDETIKIKVLERIEEDLRLIGCPHPLSFSIGGEVDVERAFPVVQWLSDAVNKMNADEDDKERERAVRRLEEDLSNARALLRVLSDDLYILNQKRVNVSKQLERLKERLNTDDTIPTMQKLISLAESLKVLKQEECAYVSNCEEEQADLQKDIVDLEEKLNNGFDTRIWLSSIDHSLIQSFELIYLGKKELATKLRKIVALRRMHDDIPTKSELVQYERRIVELYAHIQEKLRQTRKCFATYNALLEIKEMMLKETSLLNSISSQFEDAFSSSSRKAKLIDSMEAIVRGIDQKRGKVQLGLEEEEKVSKALKEKYATEIAEQRRLESFPVKDDFINPRFSQSRKNVRRRRALGAKVAHNCVI